MISVVIPVYKKTEDFLKNLENNLQFLKDTDVVIVNDDPTESIAVHLKKYTRHEVGIPTSRSSEKVTLIENEKNLGFAGAVNAGVAKTKNNFVFLLNSDVILTDDSYKSSIKEFEDDDRLFAITFAQKEKDGSLVGKNKIFWRRGLIHHAKADDLIAGETGWAEGGSSIIRKDMFTKLKGFNALFSPFYWEDIDLSYRARKKGWRILFDPSVVVEHHHASTIRSFWSEQSVKTISYRNQILCSWKHVKDTNLIYHLLFIIYYLFSSIIKGDIAFLRGYTNAFLLLFSPRFWKQ